MRARFAAALGALGLAACGHVPQLSANWYLVSRLPADSSAAVSLDLRMVVAVLNRGTAPVRITRLVVNPGPGEWRAPEQTVDLAVGQLWVIDLAAQGGQTFSVCAVPTRLSLQAGLRTTGLAFEPREVRIEIVNPMPTALPERWDRCPR